MTTSLPAQPLTCALLAPLIALTPALGEIHARPLSPQESASLAALCAPNLDVLRAGRVEAPAPFSAAERADLEAAQQTGAALAERRAGRGINEDAWPWIVVGAAIVVLILVL